MSEFDVLVPFMSSGVFRSENYSPESGKEPICPHYEIIKICCDFTGTDISRFYCGCNIKYVDDMSFLSGRRGNEYNAETMCSDVGLRLQYQIDTLYQPVPNIKNLLEKSVQDLTGDEAKQVLMAKELEDKKNKILSRFKTTTFNVSKVHINDASKDCHFKAVDKPEDVSDEEAINTAKLFLEALQKAAYGCEQRPHSTFIGEMS